MQVAAPDAGRSDVAPRRIRRRRLADLEGRLPGRQRRLVLAQPEPAFAKPEQGRGGDRGVVEPDHPAVVGSGLGGSRRPPAARRPLARSATASSRDRRPGRDGSGVTGGRASSIGPTILDLPACADGSRRSGRRPSWPRSSPPSRSPTSSGARFNVAPTDEAFVVVQREDRRAVTAYRWGLVPHWSTDLKVGVAHVQRAGRDHHGEPGVPGGVSTASLPCPGRLVLRVEARGCTIRQPYRVVARPTACRWPWPVCGRVGTTRRPRRSGARSRSSRRRRMRRWPISTTGCRWCSTRRPGTAG